MRGCGRGAADSATFGDGCWLRLIVCHTRPRACQFRLSKHLSGLSTYHCGLSTCYCGLSTYHCGLSTYHCGLSTCYCGLSTYYCGLSTCYCGLSTYHCGLSTCYCGLRTNHCGLSTCHVVIRLVRSATQGALFKHLYRLSLTQRDLLGEDPRQVSVQYRSEGR